MNATSARPMPLIAIAGGLAALMAIVSLAPDGETRSRFRNQLPAPEATRIEVDRKAGAIRFYVDGNQVALMDAQGLAR